MADEVGKIYITIDGKDVGVKDVIAAVDQRMRSLTNTSGVLDSAIAKTTAAHARQEQQILRNAQVMASLQSALGNNAAAAQTYANASSKISNESLAQIRANTGIINSLNKVTSAALSTERALLSKAQALARSQVSAGNLTAATNTLRSALGSVTSGTQAYYNAQVQLNTVNKQIANSSIKAEQDILKEARSLATLQIALGNSAEAARIYASAALKMNAGSSARLQAESGLVSSLNRVNIAEEASERSTIRKAQVMAKAQAASGNYAGASQTLQNALSGVNRQTQAALDAEAQLNTVTAKLAQQHQNAANQALRQAMAEARLSATSGPGGRQQGISNLQNAIQGSSADLMLQTKAQTQLNQMMSAGAVQGNTLVGTLKNIGTAALAAGTAFVAMQAVDFAKDAVNSANKLEKTMAVTKALAQTDAKYAEVLDIARRNQDKFGGSLQENMSALGKLVNISNRANTNLQQMDNIARRLSIVDPLQG